MPQPAVTTEIQQPLDAHGYIATEIALYIQLADLGAQRIHLPLAQIANLACLGHSACCTQLLGGGAPNAVDVGERDNRVLVIGYVDTSTPLMVDCRSS